MEKVSHIEKFIRKNSEFILIFLLVTFFITEAISKITMISIREKWIFQPGLKAAVLGLITIGLMIFRKKEFFYLLILALIFGMGQFFIPEKFTVSSVIYFAKYCFMIAMIGFFTEKNLPPKKNLIAVFEFLLLANSILIFIGFLFDIRYFHSYSGSRFGYNGLIIGSGTATYFYAIGLCCFLIQYGKKMISDWRFWILVSASVLVGTKSLILVIIALGFYYIFNFIETRFIRNLFFFLIVLTGTGAGWYFFFVNPVFQPLAQNQGFLTSFLSLRDVLFLEATYPYILENWSWINYLFGGVSDFELRSQMEFADLFFFWGFLGGILYLLFFIKSFWVFNNFSKKIFFVSGLILIISFLSGNFFYNASIPIFVIVLQESLQLNSQNNLSRE